MIMCDLIDDLQEKFTSFLVDKYLNDKYINRDSPKDFVENLKFIIKMGLPMYSNGRIYFFTELLDESEWPVEDEMYFDGQDDDGYDVEDDGYDVEDDGYYYNSPEMVEEFDDYYKDQYCYLKNGSIDRALKYVKSYHVKASLNHCQWIVNGRLHRENGGLVFMDETWKSISRWYMVENKIEKVVTKKTK